MTSSGRLVPEVDGLRFVAIASVLLFHAGDAVARALPAQASGGLATVLAGGNAGVPLFFAVSGFVIGLPFAEHALASGPRVSLRAYFLRRLTRLEPPYLANLLLLSLLLWHRGEPVRSILVHLVPSAVYQHALVFGTWSPINFVAWSLEVEVQLYVLAPLLARVFFLPERNRRTLLVLAIAGGSLLNAALAGEGPNRFNLSAAAWIHYFLIGLLMADLRVSGDLGRWEPRTWGLLGFLAWGAMIPIRLSGTGYPLLFPTAVAVAFGATLASPLWRRILSNPWITTIGGMCYTIYLYHAAIMQLVLPFVPLGWYLGAVLILSIVAILVSVPLFVLLERPFMAWRRR